MHLPSSIHPNPPPSYATPTPPLSSTRHDWRTPSQLQETWSSLANDSDKFHLLDSLITEQDSFKHDVKLVNQFTEERKQEAQAREQCHNVELSSVTTRPPRWHCCPS